MGVFEAVRRNHTKPEDRLTAAVFGTLETLDRSIFLMPILRSKLGNQVDLKNLEFHYWRKPGRLGRGNRTPDVVLSSETALISIECKLEDDFDVDQLVEEYRDRPDCLIAVSHHWSEPPEIKQAKDLLKIKRPQLLWMSWRDIYAFLRDNKPRGNRIEKKLIDDLLLLMERKELMMFDGFKKPQLKAAASLASQWERLYAFSQQCDVLFEDVKARLGKRNIICSPESFLLGYTKGVKDGISNWTGIEAWDSSWIAKHKKTGSDFQKLTAHLHLNFTNPEKPLELVVGYSLLFRGRKGESLRQKLAQKAKKAKVAGEIRKLPYSIAFWHLDEVDWVKDWEREARHFSDKWLSSQAVNDDESITFGRIFSQDSLISKNLASQIEECMVNTRNTIKENSLYIPGYSE